MNIKTINNVSKFFKEKCCNGTEDEKLVSRKYNGIMDPASVLMYVPKIQLNEVVFEIFDSTKQKVPQLDKTKYQSCRFAKEYLKLILKTLIEDKSTETVTISVGNGMPLIIEDKFNGFILAPRHKNDSEINEWHDCELL